MNNWKKELKKNLDENLVRETPRIEKLEKTETKKKRLPLWGKILIPLGAATALTLAVALPLTLRKNEVLSDGDVFLKAGDALAELAKPDSSNSNPQVQAKARLITSEGKTELGGVSSMVYYIGLLLNNGYDVVHQPMNFAFSYYVIQEGVVTVTYSLDVWAMVAADIDRANNKLMFYGRQKIRVHDSTNATPFFDHGSFVYDITYDEENDTVSSFSFNFNTLVLSQIVPEYIEYDGTSYWLSTNDEDSPIKELFTGYFATVMTREAAAVDAQGGGRFYVEANNHAAELMGLDIRLETIA